MKYVMYIGIDPGVSGGVAWLSDELTDLEVFKFSDKTERDISDLFRDFAPDIKFAVIEHVHAFPKDGVASVWKFAQNYGMLRAYMIAYDIPFDEVLPKKWQAFFGLKKTKSESRTAFKRKIKAKAQQTFPHIAFTNATADAALIAEYCRRNYGS